MSLNNKKSVKELLLILNLACEDNNIEYKVSYDYKYVKMHQIICVKRKMIAFSGTVPCKWFYPNTDQDLIEMILEEMELYK